MSTQPQPNNLTELAVFIHKIITAKGFISPKNYKSLRVNVEKKSVELKFPSPLLLRQAEKDPDFKAPFIWTKCPTNENANTMSFFLV